MKELWLLESVEDSYKKVHKSLHALRQRIERKTLTFGEFRDEGMKLLEEFSKELGIPARKVKADYAKEVMVMPVIGMGYNDLKMKRRMWLCLSATFNVYMEKQFDELPEWYLT